MSNPSEKIAFETCTLQHRLFATLGEICFRRSDSDGAAVMIVPLGERSASVPLRSLQREFGIDDESADGQMLRLITEALDFVAGMRPGDRLPNEVLNGGASWAPDAIHLRVAHARLSVQMLHWINGTAGQDPAANEQGELLRIAEDPAARKRVQEAFYKAAEALGLPDSESVMRLVEDMAAELAYIEALRSRLLKRLQAMHGKIDQLLRNWHGDSHNGETLTQVFRLTSLALKQIGGRFDELDAQTGEVLAALRNAEGQRAFIRSNRDWLYRSQRAWEPLLREWDGAMIGLDEGMRALLSRTYKFLAPRFMPVTEWVLTSQPNRPRKPTAQPRMEW